MKLNIGTFNIQHGILHAHRLITGEDRVDLTPMADYIAELGLDICGLNEIYNCPVGGEFPEQAAFIGRQLGYYHAFAKAIDVRPGYPYGVALVSRYPILSTRCVPITLAAEDRAYENGYYENRVLLIAEIAVDGHRLTVMVSHFGLNPDEALLAAETVLQELPAIQTPVVLMGDFNITPDRPELKAIANVLTDTAYLIEGPDGTWPSHKPDRKIDYVFISKDLQALSCRIPEKVVSDHRPVAVELNMD